LLGVLLASALPALTGLTTLWVAFTCLLALGLFALRRAPQPAPAVALMGLPNDLWRVWSNLRFRSLAGLFAVNGIATAIPASLVLFFAQDVLRVPPVMEAVFLCAYFLAGAAAMPLWMRAIRRWGLPGSWLASMVLAIGAFAMAATLAAGDDMPFVFICLVSGICLGADLVIPGALLTGCIQAQGDHERHEGSYIGWWHFFTKLNLALAAGVALPLLQTQGYVPGQRDPQALDALVLAYCMVPCILKSVAAASLAVHVRRQTFA
jgi:Na+/melibiose symporter-like transporter